MAARPSRLRGGRRALQDADTSDLVFSPHAMVSYISTIVTLEPGDVIATGTPGGVGVARTPPRFLRDGQLVVTTITGLGECRNNCRPRRSLDLSDAPGNYAI